jgi:hypothetical protein
MTDAKNYTVRETLKNGTQVRIRSIRPANKDNFQSAINDLDLRSIDLRFFTDNKSFS